MLSKPIIKKTIESALAQYSISSGQTIALLTQMLQANIRDYLACNPDGSIIKDEAGRPTFDLERARKLGKLHLIEDIRFTDTGITIKLPKKSEVISLMMKFHGLLVEKVDVSVKTDGDAIRRELAAKLRAAIETLPASEQAKLGVIPGLDADQSAKLRAGVRALTTPTGPSSSLGGPAPSAGGEGEGAEIEV